MNLTNPGKRRQIVAALVEGNSIRATCRMTGAAKNAVVKLLRELGTVCTDHQDRVMRNLPCRRLQCDEIWSFCYTPRPRTCASTRWASLAWAMCGADGFSQATRVRNCHLRKPLRTFRDAANPALRGDGFAGHRTAERGGRQGRSSLRPATAPCPLPQGWIAAPRSGQPPRRIVNRKAPGRSEAAEGAADEALQ